MEPSSFQVVNLPKLNNYSEHDAVARSLALKLRDLRLLSLKTNPESFAASYESEVQQGLNRTLERLGNPRADHFVVIDRPIHAPVCPKSAGYIECLVQAEWLGMIVSIARNRTSTVISAKSEPLAQSDQGNVMEESKGFAGSQSSTALVNYHLNGTFVHPKARGKGAGQALLQRALHKAEAEAQKLGVGMHCTVLVDSGNISALRLYEKRGFTKTGEETYVPQPRGELETESEKVAWHLELTRGGEKATRH